MKWRQDLQCPYEQPDVSLILSVGTRSCSPGVGNCETGHTEEVADLEAQRNAHRYDVKHIVCLYKKKIWKNYHERILPVSDCSYYNTLDALECLHGTQSSFKM